ncbi:DNA-binding GntR family transcriptional regulator [Rhodococcus sp. 27YEA15]|uniref:GntR family transcriptional regulator n=1 Tax=Rhodococcus sp. 27YEA15 TaxID=3156259 RepID=UPI003C7A111F
MMASEALAEEAPAAVQLASDAANKLRELIGVRTLLPGEKIRQVEVAQQLGVSRSPLREALRTLESEGVVSYETNRGYVVTKLDLNDLAQIYRLRALIEDELLRSISGPTPEVLADAEVWVDELAAAAKAGDSVRIIRAHREFQIVIFSLSDRAVFRRELDRLWNQAIAYRATYQWPPATMARIVKGHRQALEALRDNDRKRLLAAFSRMRSNNVDVIVGLPRLD